MLDKIGSTVGHASHLATADQARCSLPGRFATQFRDSPGPFEIVVPDGAVERFGPATASHAPADRRHGGFRS